MTNNVSTFNGYINRSLNAFASASEYCFNRGGTVIAPGVLGAMGGWLTSIGVGRGLLQGVVSGTYHAVIHVPIANYVAKNTGEGEDQIHRGTAYFIGAIGTIAGVAVPIIFTAYCGNTIVDGALAYFPADGNIRWVLESGNSRSYTLIRGALVNISPALVQYWISAWSEVDRLGKKHN